MHQHERSLLAHAGHRHQRFLREAEAYRALRDLRAPGTVHRARSLAATVLHGLATRLEPHGRSRLT